MLAPERYRGIFFQLMDRLGRWVVLWMLFNRYKKQNHADYPTGFSSSVDQARSREELISTDAYPVSSQNAKTPLTTSRKPTRQHDI